MTREDADFIGGLNMRGEISNEAYRKIMCHCEEQEPTTKNDLGVDWESYKDADGNSLDYLILNVLQNNFDCGDAYGYTVADKIISLLPSVTPQEPFMATPCISSKVCEHDRMVTLDKIRAEIDGLRKDPLISWASSEMIIDTILEIIDKYKAETEDV